MPLINNEFNRGKCGFKLIQYGAVGLPSVASAVGFNNEVLLNNETGYLAKNNKQWVKYLSRLIKQSSLRKKMGTLARTRVIEKYSIDSVLPSFVDVFNNTIKR